MEQIGILRKTIDSLPEGIHTIAIDGRSASGKTTLALALAEAIGARVVHMDDFFLPMELRTEERLAIPGGNVHYERIQNEVLPYITETAAFSYERFDCATMQLTEHRQLPEATYTIIEGAYSCHPFLGDYMSLRVFMDVDSKVQIERIRKRNGMEKAEIFQRKWIPLEEAYFQAYGIREKAQIILK